jgi:hypothetical protein
VIGIADGPEFVKGLFILCVQTVPCQGTICAQNGNPSHVIAQRNLSLLANRLFREHGGRRIPEAVLERDYCLAVFGWTQWQSAQTSADL